MYQLCFNEDMRTHTCVQEYVLTYSYVISYDCEQCNTNVKTAITISKLWAYLFSEVTESTSTWCCRFVAYVFWEVADILFSFWRLTILISNVVLGLHADLPLPTIILNTALSSDVDCADKGEDRNSDCSVLESDSFITSVDLWSSLSVRTELVKPTPLVHSDSGIRCSPSSSGPIRVSVHSDTPTTDSTELFSV